MGTSWIVLPMQPQSQSLFVPWTLRRDNSRPWYFVLATQSVLDLELFLVGGDDAGASHHDIKMPSSLALVRFLRVE